MKSHRTPTKWSIAVLIAMLVLLLPAYRLPAQADAAVIDPFLRLWPTVSNNTDSASIAVDWRGGLHMGFSAYTAASGVYPAYYAYCASACQNKANWSMVAIGNLGAFGKAPRLVVDPLGRPRMLWYQELSISGMGVYQYAECNSACASASSWKIVSLFTEAVGPDNSRYFALDPQGRPRFVYTDTPAAHQGTFYAYCDATCTTAANWKEVKIDDSYLWYDFSLNYADSGAVRMAFRDATGSPDALGYAECSASCGSAANWGGAIIVGTLGSDNALALDLDAQGRPRIAFYTGYLDSGNPENNLLFYAWCNTGCIQAANWSIRQVGLADGYGQYVDLTIDAQNHPRLAFYVDDIATSTYGLGYAACSAGCESSSPTWQAQMAETGDDLDASDPIARQSGCSQSFWLDVGKRPAIAVDALGQPRIGYTAIHYQGGTCTIHEDIRLVRFAMQGTLQPPANGKYKVYLALARK